MVGPGKNRHNDYVSGWLPCLVSIRVATDEDANAAMGRVAEKVVEEMEERRELGRAQIEQLRRTVAE
jgi:hypothetical protein